MSTLETLQYQNVLYHINNFTLNVNGTTFEVPVSMITQIEIIKEFELQIYPLYYLTANIPLWVYTLMTDSPDNISVTMTLKYKIVNPDQTGYYNTSGYITELTGNFKIVIPDVNRVADSRLQTSIERAAGATDVGYNFNDYYLIEMSLYNTAAWNASFNTINAVLSSANMTNALTYCLGASGLSNILLERADNASTYSEFKILPTSTIKNILRIIEDYNFHTSGSIVFFDLAQGYILPKKTGCTVWINNEYTTTRLECRTATNDAVASTGGVLLDTINKMNIIGFSKDAYSVQILDSAPLLIQDANTFLTIQLGDVAMNMLTPNKDFIISIDGDGSKYSGRYRLYSYTMVLSPSGSFYKTSCKVVFRK